jgi:uncharacterized repeat protein (TIGR01451 family)
MLRQNIRIFDTRFLDLLLILSLLIASAMVAVAPPVQGLEPALASGVNSGAGLDAPVIGSMMEAARYQFVADSTRPGSWAPNPAHGYDIRMGSSGPELLHQEGSWTLNFELAGLARGEQIWQSPGANSSGISAANPARFEYVYTSSQAAPGPTLVEWFFNQASGLEHGLAIYQPVLPAGGSSSHPLTIRLAYRGSLSAQPTQGGSQILFLDPSGAPRLAYEKLLVIDSSGRILPATLGADGSFLLITVEDQEASYPIYVDPLLTQQTAQVTASDGAADDYFGYSAAIAQDTAVIGAPGRFITTTATNDAAYIFYRNTGGSDAWGQIRRLAPPDGDNTQRFGFSVDIFGDIAVVGAPLYDLGGSSNAGSIYVYYRNQGGADQWGFVKRITAEVDGGQGDRFGRSVAISGDTIVVGAPFYDPPAGDSAGKVYIYQRNQGGVDQWGLVTSIYPTDPLPGDRFGFSVDIHGDTIAVSSPYAPDEPPSAPNRHAGAAYIFERNQGGANGWGQVRKVTGSAPVSMMDSYFGWSLALDNDHLLVGAPGYNYWAGMAFIYSRNQGGANQWGQQVTLTPGNGTTGGSYGWSVALSDEIAAVSVTADEGNPAVIDGSVYLYDQNFGGANTWTQIFKLVASDHGAGNNFGQGLAIDNSGIVAGANLLEVNSQPYQGAAYFFYRSGSSWFFTASPDASDGAAGDRLGDATALEGDVLVVGAPSDDGSAGADQGAAYVFYRHQSGADGWGQVRKITASDGAAGDRFGASVSISMDKIVVGAPQANISAQNDQGAAYVFARNQGGAENWGFVRKLTASDGAAGDLFGSAVSIQFDHVASGAPGDASGSGSAYIFERNTGGAENWGQVTKASAADALGFGKAVALSHDRLLVGAPQSTVSFVLNQGAAYIFARNQGGADSWGQVRRLVAPDGVAGDVFGISVAFSAGIAVVGAPGDDSGSGALYFFYRNQGGPDNWGYSLRRTSQNRVEDGYLGTSLSMSEDLLAAGAPGQNTVFTFQRNRTGPDQWSQFLVVAEVGSATGDLYGQSVALSGTDLVAGSPIGGVSDRGEAFVYRLTEFFNDLEITKTVSQELLAPGGVIQFVIEFANKGDRPATGVVITDTMPAVVVNPTFTSSGVSLTQVAPFVWEAADMLPGSIGTLIINGIISGSAASGVYTNQVEISSADPEVIETNNLAQVSFTIDATPPLPPVLTSPANGSTSTLTSQTLHWTASPSGDVAGYLLSFNGNVVDVGPVLSYPVNNLTNGTYTWRVAAYDLAGNVGSYTNPWTFTIQSTTQNLPPVANPGAAQVVLIGELVSLDGSGSNDPDNHLPLSFTWTQTAGSSVVLTNPNQAVATFTAPSSLGVLTFRLQVRDFLGLASTASVNVTVTSHRLFVPVILRQ